MADTVVASGLTKRFGDIDVGDALAAATWIVVVTGALFVLPLNLLRRRLVK